MVVCRLARVIQEKARTAIDAGRAKGVSNSFSLSGHSKIGCESVLIEM